MKKKTKKVIQHKKSSIINEITKNKDDSFLNAALPLIRYMAEHIHPHHTAIVTSTGAELLEGKESTGKIMNFIVD